MSTKIIPSHGSSQSSLFSWYVGLQSQVWIDTHVHGVEIEHDAFLNIYLDKLEAVQKRTHETQPSQTASTSSRSWGASTSQTSISGQLPWSMTYMYDSLRFTSPKESITVSQKRPSHSPRWWKTPQQGLSTPTPSTRTRTRFLQLFDRGVTQVYPLNGRGAWNTTNEDFNPPVEIAFDLIKSLVHSSPRLRLIFQQIVEQKVIQPLDRNTHGYHQRFLIMDSVSHGRWYTPNEWWYPLQVALQRAPTSSPSRSVTSEIHNFTGDPSRIRLVAETKGRAPGQ